MIIPVNRPALVVGNVGAMPLPISQALRIPRLARNRSSRRRRERDRASAVSQLPGSELTTKLLPKQVFNVPRHRRQQAPKRSFTRSSPSELRT